MTKSNPTGKTSHTPVSDLIAAIKTIDRMIQNGFNLETIIDSLEDKWEGNSPWTKEN